MAPRNSLLTRRPRGICLLALSGFLCAPTLVGDARADQLALAAPTPYESVVQRVSEMVSDGNLTALAAAKGLQLLNVLWEDTGRWEGSAVGPNISDVTIEVEGARADRQRGSRRYLMPVLRHDNFTDKTADVKLDAIWLKVGNHRTGKLTVISLRELLRTPSHYLSNANAGRIKGGTLLAPRDSHALVSAQHTFLPIAKGGKATFWPVIFNYQSVKGDPAVLTILVTRQGTSMTIVDNQRDTIDSGSWGQRLYFNANGQKAPLIAERKRDVDAKGTTANGDTAASLGADANVLMLIQVPLVQRNPPPRTAMALAEGAMSDSAAPMASSARRGGARDLDTAVLGHGPTEGKYTELDGLTIERDARFPVRVTMQFYQATETGTIDATDITAMQSQINKVYAGGDYVGSLVVPSPADRQRPTTWTGVTTEPNGVTWYAFPGLVERYTRVGWTWLAESQVRSVKPPLATKP